MAINPINRVKARRPGLVGAFCVLLVLTMHAAVPLAAPEALDAIVAVVNDDVVVRSELERQVDLIVPQMQQKGTTVPPRAQLEKQVLDRLIMKHLIQQRAKSAGVEVDSATLNEALSNIAQRNGLTLEALQATLEAGGIRFEDFKEDTRSQILATKIQSQEVTSKIQVTKQEIDRFLAKESSRLINREQVRLQHILVALPENPTEAQVKAAKDKATRLVGEIRSGADFSAVAARESDGTNALEGGDLGWFEMGAVPALVADLAYTLNEGEISNPIRSPSGFHIIKMREIKGSTPKNVTQTHARHILVRTNEILSDAEAKQRLEQLRIRILGGDDFENLARSHSDDTGSALKGGDLGWVSPGTMVPEFEEAMDKLPVNGVSEPFKSPFGWHLVQVLERRDQDTADEYMRMKAREALQRRKAEEAIEAWQRQIRDEAYVEIRLKGDS